MCVKEIGRNRLMEEKDVKQVEQVEKQCFSVPWSEHILKDGLTGRFDTYLVWEKGGIIAGYCALRVLADEGEIQRIAVLPSWRRNGIAKSLMEAMIQDVYKRQIYRTLSHGKWYGDRQGTVSYGYGRTDQPVK